MFSAPSSLKSKEEEPAPSSLRSKEEVIKNFILSPLFEAHQIVKTEGRITVDTLENKISSKIVYNVKYKSSISELYKKHFIAIILKPEEHYDKDTIVEPDILFIVFGKCSMWIEAKRFYQDDSVSKYCGKKGLGRFLSGYYSRQDDDGGMIAYIQRGCISDIQSEIMERVKIMDCIELTENIGINASFLSVHKRITTGNIKMYHLFFDFVNLD
jgi:hypothetical protein